MQNSMISHIDPITFNDEYFLNHNPSGIKIQAYFEDANSTST